MIEERAVVARVAGDTVWVTAYGPESCPRCAQGQGCGGGVLARLVGRRRPHVAVTGPIAGLRVGDTVIVGIDEDVLISASLWVYLAPLAGMFALGAFAQLVLAVHDVLVAGFGLAGLIAGFAATRRFSGRAEHSPRFRPTVLRREAQAAADCARVAAP